MGLFLFGLLAGGGLWLIGKAIEPYENRRREERIRQRQAEVVSMLEASWKDHDDRVYRRGKYAPRNPETGPDRDLS
jgi:hypothetical protein